MTVLSFRRNSGNGSVQKFVHGALISTSSKIKLDNIKPLYSVSCPPYWCWSKSLNGLIKRTPLWKLWTNKTVLLYYSLSKLERKYFSVLSGFAYQLVLRRLGFESRVKQVLVCMAVIFKNLHRSTGSECVDVR